MCSSRAFLVHFVLNGYSHMGEQGTSIENTMNQKASINIIYSLLLYTIQV
jgi:hypothetical protein